MSPTQQIIPAPRQPDGGYSGRAFLEIAQPPFAGGEAPVNYTALLGRHRTALGIIFAAALVLSLLSTLLENKVYRSEAILEVTGINQDFLDTNGVDPTANQLSGDAYIETQTKLLTSPPVVQRTVQLLGPKVPPAIGARQSLSGLLSRWLGQPPANQAAAGEAVVLGMLADAKVKVDGTSDLITLTVSGPEPQLTADTANMLTAQYIELSQRVRGDSAGNPNRFLLAQLADARQNLRDSESELQDYARQAGIVIPSASQEGVAADKLRQIQSDLAKAEAEQAGTQSQVESSRTNMAETIPQVLDDPTFRDNRARVAELLRQLAELSVSLTPSNYKIQRLQAQIADLERQSSHQRANIIRRLGVQKAETARRKQLLRSAYQQRLSVVSDQSSKEVRYDSLKKVVDADRDIYQAMLRRVKQAGIVAALKSSDVRVVSPATPQASPYRPSLALNLALGLLFGIALSTGYILVRERKDASQHVPGRARRRFLDDGTPVIGTILNDCDLRTEDPAYVGSYNSYAGRPRD